MWLLLLATLLLAALPSARAMSEADFLPPEQAFRMSAGVVPGNVLEVRFAIAPGYYLYQEPFAVAAEGGAAALGALEVPPGKVIYDAVFEKDLETHREAVALRVPLLGEPRPLTVQVTSQGCAEAGLCYPPQTWPVALAAGPGGWVAEAAVPDSGWGAPAAGFGNWRDATDLGLADALAGAALWQTAGVFFVLGVLLSLTPCVLPMLPILSSLLVGDQAARTAQGRRATRWRGLGLALSYVLGMSLVYTAAGVAAGLTGASLAATLQNPWVLGVFAALLVVFALAMFDVFTVQLPGRWQTAMSAWVDRLPGGRVTGAFGMGAISALIVGPCVAAPLAGALIYISQTGDVWVGAVALFALAWGMGVTLLLAGASASALLPRAGAWMTGVKQFFGVLLLGVAWWMLLPVLPAWVQMAGWALLAFFAASLLGAFNTLAAGASVGARLGKGLGWLLVLVGAVQVVGLASGGRDALQPLGHLAAPAAVGPWGGGAPGLMPGAGMGAGAGSAVGTGSGVGVGGGPAAVAGAPPPAAGFSTPAGAGVPVGPGFAGAVGGAAVNGAAEGSWPTASGAVGGARDSGWLTGADGGAGGSGLAAGEGRGVSSGPGAVPQPGALTGAAAPVGGWLAPPAAWPGGHPPFQRIDTLAELDAIIAQAGGRPVMLDFYADWCVSCKEMERFTFSQPAVAQRMAQMVLVQADVTANNADHQALLRRFRLFGPPGIIFFDAQGREQTATRVIGFQNAERFGAVLDRVLGG